MENSHFDWYMFLTGWFNHQLSNHLLQLEFEKIIFGYLSGHPLTVVSPPSCQDMCRKLKPEIGRGQKNDKIGVVGDAKKKNRLASFSPENGCHGTWKSLEKPAFLGSMLVNLQCWIPALGFPEGNWLETKLLQISVTIDQLVQSFAGND